MKVERTITIELSPAEAEEIISSHMLAEFDFKEMPRVSIVAASRLEGHGPGEHEVLYVKHIKVTGEMDSKFVNHES